MHHPLRLPPFVAPGELITAAATFVARLAQRGAILDDVRMGAAGIGIDWHT